MKRIMYCLLMVAVGLALLLAAAGTRGASALPEYSAQVGEPCATCHVSPSGGGARAPRGQAWVGSGKPGVVPSLLESLEALGVHLEVNQADYTNVPAEILPAQLLQTVDGNPDPLNQMLRSYDGN